MDQRRVRLGDVLDDYCPRERRVTNHAVVALVGSDIKLTRCSTCDTEHPYKAARVPPRRQTRLVAALSNAGADGALIAAPAEPAGVKPPPPAAALSDVPPPVVSRPPLTPSVDSVRRPLIRATLGRPEAVAASRQVPVFTVREQTGRDGNVDRGKSSRKRRNGGRPGAEPNGNKADGHPGQFARPGYGKNEAKPTHDRNGNGRPERFNRSSSRSRGKGRSR
jgi:hypothetical protein